MKYAYIEHLGRVVEDGWVEKNIQVNKTDWPSVYCADYMEAITVLATDGYTPASELIFYKNV